jgi:glycerol-3-phosphate dehydrogenase (NAD(P)+)
MKAAIFGTGSWGCAFGRHLAMDWDEIVLWGVEESQVRAINETRRNPDFLGDVFLPDNLRATLDMADAVAGCGVMFMVVPSQAVRGVARLAAAACPPDGAPVINLAKGLELDTLKLLSTVIAEEIGTDAAGGRHPVAVLLGPSHAEEVVKKQPTAVVLAGQPGTDWTVWQDRLSGPNFRIYTNDDLVGVEASSAFKNVIALAVGLCDGLKLGDNARGTLMTRGMAELARVGQALGGRTETFYGLAGIGDMITTCTSRHSRNRNFGEAVVTWRGDPEALLAGKTQVVEGVVMTRAALKLGEKFGIELPITKEIYHVLYSGKPPRQAMRDLMDREQRSETD